MTEASSNTIRRIEHLVRLAAGIDGPDVSRSRSPVELENWPEADPKAICDNLSRTVDSVRRIAAARLRHELAKQLPERILVEVGKCEAEEGDSTAAFVGSPVYVYAFRHGQWKPIEEAWKNRLPAFYDVQCWVEAWVEMLGVCSIDIGDGLVIEPIKRARKKLDKQKDRPASSVAGEDIIGVASRWGEKVTSDDLQAMRSILLKHEKAVIAEELCAMIKMPVTIDAQAVQESIGKGVTWSSWNFSVTVGRWDFDESAFEDVLDIRSGHYKDPDAAIDALLRMLGMTTLDNDVEVAQRLSAFRDKVMSLINIDSLDQHGYMQNETYTRRLVPQRQEN